MCGFDRDHRARCAAAAMPRSRRSPRAVQWSPRGRARLPRAPTAPSMLGPPEVLKRPGTREPPLHGVAVHVELGAPSVQDALARLRPIDGGSRAGQYQAKRLVDCAVDMSSLDNYQASIVTKIQRAYHTRAVLCDGGREREHRPVASQLKPANIRPETAQAQAVRHVAVSFPCAFEVRHDTYGSRGGERFVGCADRRFTKLQRTCLSFGADSHDVGCVAGPRSAYRPARAVRRHEDSGERLR